MNTQNQSESSEESSQKVVAEESLAGGVPMSYVEGVDQQSSIEGLHERPSL